ncbi:hypothetical protein [Propionivibrio soli]|uniref:hypothetical protein n=1 Tax=Propionivibrio soli TaxID=2976531 RepID=UPI0021E98235|nr:hypothetical protein [Propionivibrio soli]
MNWRCILVLVMLLCSGSACAQEVIYHCLKDGRKMVTDQPCADLGAQERKRVNTSDMPPLNTSQGLSVEERQREQGIRERLYREGQQYEQIREQQKAVAAAEERERVRLCDSLWRQKKAVIAQQRAYSSDYWNERHRIVNDRIYELNCSSR